MKLIIAGGRDYQPCEEDRQALDWIFETRGVTEVVSGTCRGADQFGAQRATLRGILVKEFPARWRKYGRGAGPIRNQRMVDYADGLYVVPGGRGTADIVMRAALKGIEVLSRVDGPDGPVEPRSSSGPT